MDLGTSWRKSTKRSSAKIRIETAENEPSKGLCSNTTPTSLIPQPQPTATPRPIRGAVRAAEKRGEHLAEALKHAEGRAMRLEAALERAQQDLLSAQDRARAAEERREALEDVRKRLLAKVDAAGGAAKRGGRLFLEGFYLPERIYILFLRILRRICVE